MTTPETLIDWLTDGDELALIDVREAGEFGVGHLLFAVPIPYSRFDVEVIRLVPNRTARIVLYDDGRSGVAERAAGRAVALDYASVHVLEGGTAGWLRAGRRLFAGVNVPSKVFGELVEQARHTPTITASDLHGRQARGERIAIVDGRPLAEYRRMNIPGSICCPNGELALRISTVVEDDSTPIVVNCAGRTRSIIGAQTLIDLGIANPVYALENGTQGWALSGFDLERGSGRGYPPTPPAPTQAKRVKDIQGRIEADGMHAVDVDKARSWLSDPKRTTYLLDVRTPEEAAADPVPAAQSAPGGQLLQATDQWLGVRGARVLLLDHDGIRAPVIARWLRRMGWDAHTVAHTLGAGFPAPASKPASLAELPRLNPVSTDELDASVRANACVVVDLRPSMEYRRAHIPTAIWSIRPRIARDIPRGSSRIVLVSDDLLVARMAAHELADHEGVHLCYLDGGFERWVLESREVVASPDLPCDGDAIDFLFFVHDRHDGNLEAARKYLEWEQGLVSQLTPGERAVFAP